MKNQYIFVVVLVVFGVFVTSTFVALGQSVGATLDSDSDPSMQKATDATFSGAKTDSVDGDPDQPIITGDVPNATDKTKTSGALEGTTQEQKTVGTETTDIGAPNVLPTESQVVPSQTKVILLAPAVDNAVIEEVIQLGIDDDEFGFVSNGKTYVRSGYLKIGDIKGEGGDAGASGGNVEATWKVEEGEKSTSKPKEIVVVGSKTIDKASPKLLEAICTGQFATCEPQGAVSPETLEDFAERTVNSFDTVNEIRMDDTKVEMDGRQPFRLFGFIPMNMRQTVSVSVHPDEFGRVKVQFPWYHVLGRKTVRAHDLEADLDEGVGTAQFSKWEASELDATKETTEKPVEEVIFNYSEVKAQMLDVMSTVLESHSKSDQ